jgi:hypothetical protein
VNAAAKPHNTGGRLLTVWTREAERKVECRLLIRKFKVLWGLRFVSLMLLALGLPVTLLLWRSARGLRAPPGSGYS